MVYRATIYRTRPHSSYRLPISSSLKDDLFHVNTADHGCYPQKSVLFNLNTLPIYQWTWRLKMDWSNFLIQSTLFEHYGGFNFRYRRCFLRLRKNNRVSRKPLSKGVDKWEHQIKPWYLENCAVREPCKQRTACIYF